MIHITATPLAPELDSSFHRHIMDTFRSDASVKIDEIKYPIIFCPVVKVDMLRLACIIHI